MELAARCLKTMCQDDDKPCPLMQVHQHMFCARLDMAVDDADGGKGLVVSEVLSDPFRKHLRCRAYLRSLVASVVWYLIDMMSSHIINSTDC